MPGLNTYPWNHIESRIWGHYYDGTITEAAAWEWLVSYWVTHALVADALAHFVA
jgi:hypothetical protein